MLKAVILIGGPSKGTRFRPLSLDIPKPLFPVAGLPMIQHHIEACSRVPGLEEIIILGYFLPGDLSKFLLDMGQKYRISVKYLEEPGSMGTAGGILHFWDQIRSGNPKGFFVLNGDVCADFPLEEMLEYHETRQDAVITIMATETNKEQALNYGCIAKHPKLGHVTHYVEKPSTFVSPLINCGIYFCSMEISNVLNEAYKKKQENLTNAGEIKWHSEGDVLQLEQDVITSLAGTGKAFVYTTTRWWSQLKSAGAAIYANCHYLELFKKMHPERLTQREHVLGDIFIDPTAKVHPSAIIGPNVSIGPNVTIGAGVRVKDALILDSASIDSHSFVTHSIVGKLVRIGRWSRVEGTPCNSNSKKPFAQMDNLPLFNKDGRLNPSITILGTAVKVPPETIVLNAIVLPNKELTRSLKYEIIL